ncbi:MAG: hypothetical protein R6X35_16555 [Candidatus Krumholzibacteriia bacterium]
MKHAIALLLFLAAAASAFSGAEPAAGPTGSFAPAHHFEFQVEMRANGVVLKAVHGTDWQGLSWAHGDERPLEFWLDESGIAGRQEDLSGARFLIHFRQTAAGATMVSSAGTHWRELGFGCGDAGACRYMVNETGVKGL